MIGLRLDCFWQNPGKVLIHPVGGRGLLLVDSGEDLFHWLSATPDGFFQIMGMFCSEGFTK